MDQVPRGMCCSCRLDRIRVSELRMEPVQKAIDCIVETLTPTELVELNRRMRLFRICMVAIFAAAVGIYSDLLSQNHLPAEQVADISKANLASWHYFQYLVVFTILLPIVLIYFLVSPILSIRCTDRAIENNISFKSWSFWIEFLLLIACGAMVCVFWMNCKFQVPV